VLIALWFVPVPAPTVAAHSYFARDPAPAGQPLPPAR
jgi:hypothetical protein